jgi:hypothetical protein
MSWFGVEDCSRPSRKNGRFSGTKTASRGSYWSWPASASTWEKAGLIVPLSVRLAEFRRAELAVLDGCGHEPMADCPEAFDREVVPLLGATGAAGPP